MRFKLIYNIYALKKNMKRKRMYIDDPGILCAENFHFQQYTSHSMNSPFFSYPQNTHKGRENSHSLEREDLNRERVYTLCESEDKTDINLQVSHARVPYIKKCASFSTLFRFLGKFCERLRREKCSIGRKIRLNSLVFLYIASSFE